MPKARRTKWERAEHRLLTRLYGGATSLPTLGPYQYDNKRVRYEQGQVLVWAACRNKEAYLAHQAEIEALAEDMAYDLDQESVLIAAHPAYVTLKYAKGGNSPR